MMSGSSCGGANISNRDIIRSRRSRDNRSRTRNRCRGRRSRGSAHSLLASD